MSDAIVRSEFIYDAASFPSCHASTIAETSSGMVAAFFGGTRERHPDVCIWVCRHVDGRWTPPAQAADGIQSDGSRLPTWNPVLFRPRTGPLMLFYKVGPSPSTWWGMLKTSDDDGRTWGDAARLTNGILGPIKNKPVQLAGGDILSPTSIEGPDVGWRVYFERSTDGGRTWTSTPYVAQDPSIKAIQPSILVHSDNRLQAIGRTRSRRLFETWSDDAGRTWTPLTLTDLPNCNSGTDAVTLGDGRHVLVYNHSDTEKVRYPLNVAVSHDGRAWDAAAVVETEPASDPRARPEGPGQYSYPAVVQSSDGLVHVTYTWHRERIKHAVLDPNRFRPRPIRAGIWPA
jgi:predicted neuraminidase